MKQIFKQITKRSWIGIVGLLFFLLIPVYVLIDLLTGLKLMEKHTDYLFIKVKELEEFENENL